MNFRIEFHDDGILRDCSTDNQFTAAVLFDTLQGLYPIVYWYKVFPSGEEELFTFYKLDHAA